MGKLLLLARTLFYVALAVPLFLAWFALYAVLTPLLKVLTRMNRASMASSYDAVHPGACLSLAVGLVELPLCVLSYMYYCAMQRALLPIGAKMRINLAKDKWTDSLYEKLANGKMDPKTLVGALLFGPRWNTHTNVNALAIMPKGRKTVLTVENIKTPGFSWQIVAYGNHMNRETIAKCGKLAGGGDTFEFPVETAAPYPTQFSLYIRLYLFDGVKEVTLPKIWMDGELLNPEPTTFSKDKLAFNYELRAQEKKHHLALHYYMYTVLCFRRFFTEYFVRWQYLPVGNPETQWLYGPVFMDYALNFKIDKTILEDHLVFCSVYSRASMPTLPCNELLETETTLAACEEDGFWAMRCVRKDGGTTSEAVLEKIKVTLNKADKKSA